jgi:hypothetical protein
MLNATSLLWGGGSEKAPNSNIHPAMRDKLQHPSVVPRGSIGAWVLELELGAFALKLCFLVTNHEMDHAIRRGNEEPVEIFP